MRKLLFISIILSILFLGFSKYNNLTVRKAVNKNFSNDFGIQMPKSSKFIYVTTHHSIDFPIEVVFKINQDLYNKISKMSISKKCLISKNFDFLKEKTDNEILKDMHSDIFLKYFPINLQNFKYCINVNNKNTWKIFIYKNAYYIYGFLNR